MAQRQQMLERQVQALRNENSASFADQLASNMIDSTKERRRLRNAEKAFELASRAESSGRTSAARSYYQRVVRIVGQESDLGERASNALTRLTGSGTDRGRTMLASTTIR